MNGELAVLSAGILHRHRPDCAFGPGFFKIVYESEGQIKTYYAQSQGECDAVGALLIPEINHPQFYRDACLDGDRKASSPRGATPAREGFDWRGDASTPDTVDGDWWLGLPQQQAMIELGLTSESDYKRVWDAVHDAVCTRDNRASQSGVRASIILKRKGKYTGGHLTRIPRPPVTFHS